jgi:hypothetical protein
VWQETGFMHVFTGDTLPRDQRASIAIEPVEVMTNAFNRAEFAAAIPLPPGQTRRFRCGVALAAGAPSTALGAAEVDVADGEDLVRGVDQPRAGQLTVVDGGGDGGGDR